MSALKATLVRKYATQKPAPPMHGESHDPTFFSALPVDMAPWPPRISRLGHRKIDRKEAPRACANLGDQANRAELNRGYTKEPRSASKYQNAGMNEIEQDPNAESNGGTWPLTKVINKNPKNNQSWLPVAITDSSKASSAGETKFGIGLPKRSSKVQKHLPFTFTLPGAEERQTEKQTRYSLSRTSIVATESNPLSILKPNPTPSIAVTEADSPSSKTKEFLSISELMQDPDASSRRPSRQPSCDEPGDAPSRLSAGSIGDMRSINDNVTRSPKGSKARSSGKNSKGVTVPTWTVNKDPSRAVASWVAEEALALLPEVSKAIFS